MKKLFTIALGILLLSSLQLNAAYLKNIPKTLTQPDGTTINCFASGDEFHNWLHDENNYTIIQDQDGYYYYATKNGDKIIPSEYKVGKTYLKSTNIQPGVNISAEQWKQKRRSKFSDAPLKSYHLKDGTPEININKISFYIRFNDDAEWAKDTAIYWNMLNADHPDSISMINFYEEVSYGKVNVRSYLYPRSTTTTVLSYQDTHNRGYFQPYNITTNPEGYDPDEEDNWDSENSSAKREWDLLERAINYLNANYTIPASMDLDYDDDGFIDIFEFFVLGEAGAWADLLWPKNWAIQDRELYINGLRLFDYNLQIEEITDDRGVGVLSHEMGHALGYPDLYHYNDDSDHLNPVGPWDIMDNTGEVPQSFGAYTKFKYGGWIDDIPEITTAGTYTINSIDSANNNCYKIASPYSTTEFFVVEFRKRAGRFEIALPGSGLLVYRINTDAGRGNRNGPPDEVYLFRPGGSPVLEGTINQANLTSTYGRQEINNTSDPRAFLNDGGPGGLYISEVSASNQTSISFRVDFNPDALYANFSASEENIFARATIDFTDISYGSPETWEWTFEGGIPATYSGQNPPSIQYITIGTYDVTLTITKGEETLTETRTDYITVSELPGANPPRDLTAGVTEANPNDVVLNWTAPESGIQTFTIQWDDGVNDGGIGSADEPDSFDALSRWLPNDLYPYEGMYITEISFFPYNTDPPSTNDYTLKIYTGSDLSTLAVDQVIPPEEIIFNQWNTFELDTPLQIDASIDLWFGVNNNSGIENLGYPFGSDNGPVVDGKGDIIYYVSDGTVEYLSDYGLNDNWNLAATVVNTLEEPAKLKQSISRAKTAEFKVMEGYNIYRDGVQINTTVVTETTYTDAAVADGNYDYAVTAIYTAGESGESNIYNVNVPWNVGIPKVEIKELSIYPNPVKDKLVVQLDELSNDPLSLQIYNQLGELVYSKEITPTSDRMEVPVSNLANGAYTLLMYTTEKAFQGKFIVMK